MIPHANTCCAFRSRLVLVFAATTAILFAGAFAFLEVKDAAARDTVTVKVVADVKVTQVSDAKAKPGGSKPAPGTGTLKGVVTFDGTPPALAPIHAKGAAVKDPEVCAAADMPDESLVIDGKTKGVQNVFIYLAKAPEGYKAIPPEGPVVFDQKGCRFLPHGLLVMTGQTVLVKSGDPIAHNTHTFPLRNTGFNQAIKASDRVGTPLIYEKPEKLPVEVKCDFHTWMRAYHLALDHPFMAVTDETGSFEIANIPPGPHEFIVWQEKAGYLNRKYKAAIKADTVTDVKLPFGASAFKAFNGPKSRTVIISSVD